MARKLLAAGLAIALLGAAATTASAQRPVDLQLNLSTQPIYGPFSRQPADYLGLPSLYTTGNIRGGRAFRGHRNFLEDRYLDSSLTRFYRDSVGVSDVTGSGGVVYGPGQAFYAPSSLLVGGTTVRRYASSGAAPFGMSFNPETTLPSPTGGFTQIRIEPEEPSAAAYPAPAALWSYLRQAAAQEETPRLRASEKILLPGQQAPERDLPTMEGLLKSGLPSLERDRELAAMARLADRTGQAPGEAEQPAFGIRPMDVLSEQFDEEELELTPQTRSELPPALKRMLEPVRLPEMREETDEGEPLSSAPEPPGPPEKPEMPEPGARGAGRPARLDEQYFALAHIELKAGVYRPAAEAFNKAGTFNPDRRWEASHGEAFARLLAREFFVAGYLLKSCIIAKPDHLRADFRLREVVDRPEDWGKTEAALAAAMENSPKSGDYAFVMAYVLIFSGRAGQAEPHLKVAEGDADYTRAVQLLREKVMP